MGHTPWRDLTPSTFLSKVLFTCLQPSSELHTLAAEEEPLAIALSEKNGLDVF